jgi:hypothetical protein
MTDQRRFSPAAIVREMREASDDKVLTLYGKRGSGSAAVEAALVIAAVSYRIVETASWERNDAFEALLKINPLGRRVRARPGAARPGIHRCQLLCGDQRVRFSRAVVR